MSLTEPTKNDELSRASKRSVDADRARARTREGRPHPLLEVERVSALSLGSASFFGRPKVVHALRHLSFHLRKQESLGFIGASGSGKSTLAHVIAGLHAPNFGRVLFEGQDLYPASFSRKPFSESLRIAFQEPLKVFDPVLPVAALHEEVLRSLGQTRKANEWWGELCDALALESQSLQRRPSELSQGYLQRVVLALALLTEPKLVVFDGATSLLDAVQRANFARLLRAYQDKSQASYVLLTHDLDFAERASHRLAVLYRGRIVELGPVASVSEHRHHPYTRMLFSARPSIHSRGQRLRVVMDGQQIRQRLEAGCAFYAHCPRAERGRCDVKSPPLAEPIPGNRHRVACFHPHL